MRKEIIQSFQTEVLPRLEIMSNCRNLLILGGSVNDPEIDIVRDISGELNLQFVGIDDKFTENFRFDYLDFNNFDSSIDIGFRPDIALCTGVVEHLWNIHAMFQNFEHLLLSETLLWITFPVSQYPHGSPDWYGAGYNPEMIKRIGELFGFQSISYGHTGNRRNYLFRHVLHIWPEIGGGVMWLYRWPLFSYIPREGSFVRKLLYQFTSIPARIILQFSSKKSTDDLLNATVGYVLFRKK